MSGRKEKGRYYIVSKYYDEVIVVGWTWSFGNAQRQALVNAQETDFGLVAILNEDKLGEAVENLSSTQIDVLLRRYIVEPWRTEGLCEAEKMSLAFVHMRRDKSIPLLRKVSVKQMLSKLYQWYSHYTQEELEEYISDASWGSIRATMSTIPQLKIRKENGLYVRK